MPKENKTQNIDVEIEKLEKEVKEEVNAEDINRKDAAAGKEKSRVSEEEAEVAGAEKAKARIVEPAKPARKRYDNFWDDLAADIIGDDDEPDDKS